MLKAAFTRAKKLEVKVNFWNLTFAYDLRA
jgi:hypothetical protein